MIKRSSSGAPEIDWASNQSSTADSKDRADANDDLRAGTLGVATAVNRRFEKML